MKRFWIVLLPLLLGLLPSGSAGAHEEHGSRFRSPQGQKPAERERPTPIEGEQRPPSPTPPPIEGEQPPPIEQQDMPEEDAKTDEAKDKEVKKGPAWDVNN
ncbi:MAG TPA: hypothetical protein VEG34_01770, partial [Thermoanaerobaculia bacterium]|nr:hypothetical protein [Thermoanaerobaculia bacterium]